MPLGRLEQYQRHIDPEPLARWAAGAVHRGTLPPGHPARSLALDSSFLTSCGAGDDGIACNQLVLAAISHARRTLEKLGGMSFSLPAYQRLSPARQLSSW